MPKLAGTGILAGLVVGWVEALVAEVAFGKVKTTSMLLGGFAGMLLGAAVETVRYLWRMRAYRLAKEHWQLSTH